MKVRPLHDRVLVEKVKTPETSKGGIFFAERFQDSQVAVVRAVGEGRSYDGPGRIVEIPGVRDLWGMSAESKDELVGSVRMYERQKGLLHVGDVVMFGIHSGTRVSVGDVEHFLLREDEVIAVIEEPDEFLAGEVKRILG